MTVDAGISDMLMKLSFWHVVSRSIRYALSVGRRFLRLEEQGHGAVETRLMSVRLTVLIRRRDELSRREELHDNS